MFLRKGVTRQVYFLGFVFLFIFINGNKLPLSFDLQGTQWSYPETIPLYSLETLPPILIADQEKTVHAFTTQWIRNAANDSIRAIVYNNWTLGKGWTAPVDIVLSPNKEARITNAFLDKEGFFHVIFFGGDETNADIYYTEAPATLASDSRAWSAPIIVGPNASNPENAVIVEDDQGILHVIYYGNDQGNGLYVVNSSDGGENWSNATPIFHTQSVEPNISLLQAIKSESGSLHVIWGVYSIDGQGRGIYYTRSDDGIEWSLPTKLADSPSGLGTQTPAIIEHEGTLIALYNMTPKITMRQSFDNGKTWDNPSVLFPRHVGVNGTLSLVIDGNRDLHLFFGQRISGNPDVHGLWHSIFLNNRWTEPEAIIKGPRVVDKAGPNGFDPYDARAIVSQGNVILVTWRMDPGEIMDNGVWFSYQVVNAPELSLATLQPEVKNDVTPTLTSLLSPTISTSTAVSPQISFEKNRQSYNPVGWLGVVMVVTILFLAGYVFLKRSS